MESRQIWIRICWIILILNIFICTKYHVIQALSTKSINMAKKNSAMIFIHGLGGDGDEWNYVLKSHMPSNLKLICPNALRMPVSVNGGMVMNSWYDIINLNPKNISENEDQVELASKTIKNLINEEISNGIPANQIILGGISQGGALAIYTTLKLASENIILGGLVALSTWIPCKNKFPYIENLDNLKNIPVFQSHGDCDVLVVPKFGHDVHQKLEKLMTTNYTFKLYSGLGHCDYTGRELKDLGQWIKNILG